jgi:hypothetical protein
MTTMFTDTNDTTEPKTRKRKAPAEPLTFEQIAERKLRDRLTRYRELVARAAAGDQLAEADMESALEILEALGLPGFSWRRDITAKVDHDAVVKVEAETRAQRPKNEKRLEEIAERMKAVEAELASLREERHRIGSMSDHLLAGYMARVNELEANHPHVLGDLDAAVRFRMEQQRKRAGVTGASS